MIQSGQWGTRRDYLYLLSSFSTACFASEHKAAFWSGYLFVKSVANSSFFLDLDVQAEKLRVSA